MNTQQKDRIAFLRGNGESYAKIATALNIPQNTVKSYCKRNNLGGRVAVSVEIKDNSQICKQCGNPLVQTPGLKSRKFCSDFCRLAWWAVHPEQIKQKALYDFTCPTCNKTFSAYGNATRKYCSHTCYINSRFRKAGG